MFHTPDPETLQKVGLIALRHGHLDHILKMTIKSLGGLDVRQALDATAFQGSATLRERIVKLARRKLGEGTALLQLQALLERARRASERRNEFIHSIWAQELDGAPQIRGNDHSWKPIPSLAELQALASDLESITSELNGARQDGFLSAAIAVAKREGRY